MPHKRFHVERPVHPRQRRQSAERIEFAVSLKLAAAATCCTLGVFKAAQNIDDMQPGDRSLPSIPGDQIVDGRFVGDLTDDP